jgi:hypothetical protein
MIFAVHNLNPVIEVRRRWGVHALIVLQENRH